jgi:hypothetical protein
MISIFYKHGHSRPGVFFIQFARRSGKSLPVDNEVYIILIRNHNCLLIFFPSKKGDFFQMLIKIKIAPHKALSI